ncbi:MAG: hypothetical protein Q9200_002196 [Gallowayella weberi]
MLYLGEGFPSLNDVRFRIHAELRSNRFDGLHVTFERPSKVTGTFSLEQLALGFIAALAEEAVKNCDQPLSTLSYTHTEFPRKALHQMTIRMNFLGNDPAENSRSNVNYALVAIPNALLSQNPIDGTKFWEDRRGFAIYSGEFGHLPGIPPITSNTATSNKAVARSMASGWHSSRRSPSRNASFPFSLSNNDYRFHIDKIGGHIPRTGIFISALEYLLQLGQANAESSVTESAFFAPSYPAWFYVRGSPEKPSFQLKVVVGIVNMITTRLVAEGWYRELFWSIRQGERVIIDGCMTRASSGGNMVCRGVRKPLQLGAGPDSSVKNVSNG